MTFTEAAVEVLRLAGRPLHYKKITEIAIERNLLSHVGKTPEVTMSSRLATMVKNDRGDAPIVKVKPGIFGLREFSAEVLASAGNGDVAEVTGHHIDIAAHTDVAEVDDSELVESAEPLVDSADGEKKPTLKSEAKVAAPLPGADVFPAEDDDDEPILGGADEDENADADARGVRRRRRRRRRGGKNEGVSGDASTPELQRWSRAPNGGASDLTEDERPAPEPMRMAPNLPDDALVGKNLADAVWSVLSSSPERQSQAVSRVADLLVRKGRLSGDPSALAPTIAAAVRADVARRNADGQRPRFRLAEGRIGLTDWWLPREAIRFEQDVVRAAERQREQVRRAFLRKLSELSAAGFAELVATWLNAEGVMSLRAVRRPGTQPGELHLAGTLRVGADETRVAVIVIRDGRELSRERIIDARGALHHYGSASMAWIVTTGAIRPGTREEASVPGLAPCSLFDGLTLAQAMEKLGVGLRTHSVPVSAMDFDLLDALRGDASPRETTRDRNFRRDRDRDRDRDRPRDRSEARNGRDRDAGRHRVERGAPPEPTLDEIDASGATEAGEDRPEPRTRDRAHGRLPLQDRDSDTDLVASPEEQDEHDEVTDRSSSTDVSRTPHHGAIDDDLARDFASEIDVSEDVDHAEAHPPEDEPTDETEGRESSY